VGKEKCECANVLMRTRGVIRNILWWDGETFHWIIHEELYVHRTL